MDEPIDERIQMQRDLEDRFRREFFSANPAASPDSFDRLLPSLLDEYYREQVARHRRNANGYLDQRYGWVTAEPFPRRLPVDGGGAPATTILGSATKTKT